MRKSRDRRQKNGRAADIEHAVLLMQTHGQSYASRYLKNMKFPDETIARVLSVNPGDRRSVPYCAGPHSTWSEGTNDTPESSTRPLSYTFRGKFIHNR
jgi:hypothetical protein